MKLRLYLFLVVIMTGSSADGFPAYYDIANHAQAQVEARQRNLPLAWVGGFPEILNESNPERGSQADLEQMAMATLQNSAVIIFFDGRNMAPVPMMVHAQFHIQDDGPLPNGASWVTPKIVFTNPEMTKILGRVSAAQMGAERDAAIYPVLQAIRDNPTAMLVPPPPPPRAAPVVAAADADDNTQADGFDTRFGRLPLNPDLVNFLNQNREMLKKVSIGLVILLILMVWVRRRA